MTTDNKDCSGCKWYATGGRGVCCLSVEVQELSAGEARSSFGDCGPSARYYEPKEPGA